LTLNSISRQPLEAESAFEAENWSQAVQNGVANGKPAAAQLIEVTRISSLADLAALGDDWKSLEIRLADSQLVFQSHDWCSAWAETFMEEPSPYTLCVLVARRAGQTSAILPAMVEDRHGLKVLRWLSEPYAQYGGILLAPGEDEATIAAAFFDACTAQKDIDLLHLRHIREDTFAWTFAEAHVKPSGYRETAPYMDLSAFADDAAYQARYTKIQRRRRKKISNAIGQLGTLSFTKHNNGEDFDRLCSQVIGHKQAWIAERGLHTTALHCPRLCAFLRSLSHRKDSTIATVLTETKAGDRSISQELGLRYNNRHCAFITAHDPALTGLSPARLHMDRSQRLALADGMDIFDLMVPGDAYKASWSSGAVEIADFARPLTIRGRLHHLVYIRTLRPLLRALYQHSPGALRQKAMSAVKVLLRK
jgi:CelD/BcsL family acetyltransferase involved in cellulose biosynthesis